MFDFFMKTKALLQKKEIQNISVLRFIFNSQYFSVTHNKVKYLAYYDTRYNCLSAYNNQLPFADMFQIGDTFVGKYYKPEKKVLAAGLLNFDVIANLNLKLISYPYPHRLHIDIIGIPEDSMKKRHLAHLLAESSSLIIRKAEG